MSTLLSLRADIVADFAGFIPEAKSVEPYGGRLNLGEINRFGQRAPGIRVAMVGGTSSQDTPNGKVSLTVNFAAFVIAEDEKGKDRDEVALAIAELAMIRVSAWSWRGNPHQASMPKDLKLESLYSGDVDRKGIALLAVTWTQTVPLGIDRFVAEREGFQDTIDPDGLQIAGALDGAPIMEADNA